MTERQDFHFNSARLPTTKAKTPDFPTTSYSSRIFVLSAQMVKQIKRGRKEMPAMVMASEVKFKGVRKRKWGKYASEIRLPNSRERIWLGSYDSAEKVARAFDAALFLLRGRNAKFNFPDHVPEVVGAGDGSPLTRLEIQAAASKFANSDSEASSSAGSPSASSSHTTDSDLTVELDGQSMDAPVGSLDDPIDFGMFPGIEDFPSEFFGIGMGMEMSGAAEGEGGLSFDEFWIEEDPSLRGS